MQRGIVQKIFNEHFAKYEKQAIMGTSMFLCFSNINIYIT